MNKIVDCMRLWGYGRHVKQKNIVGSIADYWGRHFIASMKSAQITIDRSFKKDMIWLNIPPNSSEFGREAVIDGLCFFLCCYEDLHLR